MTELRSTARCLAEAAMALVHADESLAVMKKQYDTLVGEYLSSDDPLYARQMRRKELYSRQVSLAQQRWEEAARDYELAVVNSARSSFVDPADYTTDYERM